MLCLRLLCLSFKRGMGLLVGLSSKKGASQKVRTSGLAGAVGGYLLLKGHLQQKGTVNHCDVTIKMTTIKKLEIK